VELFAQELMGLIEAEGLGAQIGDFAGVLAQLHGQMGDLVKAREYALMAVEKQVHFKGYDSHTTEQARELLAQLEMLETTGK
jgi:hypothetical protein